MLSAFFRALIYGLLLGGAVGVFPLFAAFAYPVLRVLRQIPFVALIALFLLWYGLAIGQDPKLPTLAMAIAIATRAARVFSQPQRKMGDAESASSLQAIVDRVVAGPREMFSSFREALRIGATLILAAQMLASQSGIGYDLQKAVLTIDSAKAAAIILLLWLVMILLDLLLLGLEWGVILFRKQSEPEPVQQRGP